MKPQLPYLLRKKQAIGLALLGCFVLAAQFAFWYFKSHHKEQIPKVVFSAETTSENGLPIILSEFNPNDLDESQWKNLGFSDNQIATILKYKEMIGGFKSKEQFEKCYPIKERFSELEPYVLLPETNAEAQSSQYTYQKFEKKRLKIPGRFNPDQLMASDWVGMGFTENQANAILKYKNYLGGSFLSKEKLKACFIINAEQFAQMSPYILLPEKVAEIPRSYPNNYPEKQKINLTYFDPNELDAEGWQKMGFSEKQVAGILKYKNTVLKGSFRSLDDVQKCYMITQRFEELKPWIRLNAQNIKQTELAKNYEAKSTVSSDVKTDFSKVDLNQITFKQLLEFGFSEKAAGSFVGYRKSLGGFVNKNQIYETYGIDRDMAEKLVAAAPLSSASVNKYTLADAPESWLKTHPYFKYSADKIIFYRISNPDDKKIWKFIKVKPEYEAKMKLYLR